MSTWAERRPPGRDVEAWLDVRRRTSTCTVTPIPLSASSEWRLVDGTIRHHSGRFFSVVGVDDGEHPPVPLLEQREIGTLGFLRRVREGHVELLAQAKVEPGNIGLAQLAPTMQATASNLARLHGGAPQFLEELFADPADAVCSTLQSEQGTRFLGKLNRNTLVTGDTDDADLPAGFAWFDAREVLAALARPHAVNTDARSVLVTSPWRLLVAGEPFTGPREGASAELLAALAHSYDVRRADALRQVDDLLAPLRTAGEPTVVPLGDLPGWRLSVEHPVTLRGGDHEVRHIAVRTDVREVAAWDQPVIDTADPLLADVDLRLVDGVAWVDLVARREPGLVHRAELGPTRVGPLAERGRTTPAGAEVLVEVDQSDEGGRFFRDDCRYRIVGRSGDGDVPADGVRLSLGEVEELLGRGGVLTNEARSALALLLCWL